MSIGLRWSRSLVGGARMSAARAREPNAWTEQKYFSTRKWQKQIIFIYTFLLLIHDNVSLFIRVNYNSTIKNTFDLKIGSSFALYSRKIG